MDPEVLNAAGLNVEVTCTNKLCGRNRVLDARRLLARWRLNLWWNTVVRELGEHMRCEACGRKSVADAGWRSAGSLKAARAGR